jgi:hypothetical protein
MQAELEKAAKDGNPEQLLAIIEEGLHGIQQSETSLETGEEESSQSWKLLTKKDLNKALILCVQWCNTSSKKEMVQECINILV